VPLPPPPSVLRPLLSVPRVPRLAPVRPFLELPLLLGLVLARRSLRASLSSPMVLPVQLTLDGNSASPLLVLLPVLS